MKAGFYPRLAFDGIRKNKRMYLPYILACIGIIMMFYIMCFLNFSPVVHKMKGGTTLGYILPLGCWVILIFSAIFLFYTNSFLIRRRKKEFGLYNILGMGKNNISVILVWETLIIAVISIAAGLVLGIVFSKLAELALLNILDSDINFIYTVSSKAIVRVVESFAVIFILLLVNSLIQVRATSAINLLKSENVGEKPPKANWVLGVLGFAILAGAYYIAVTIKDPVEAIGWFFVAVIMVIVATYLIMIAGSVLLCRILQKNKRYYYKANHFVSVSSMAYRMKRNGAGLASICVLATMVLVMISSTSSLYIGQEDSLNQRYPRAINVDTRFEDLDDLGDENVGLLRSSVNAAAKGEGAEISDVIDYRYASVGGVVHNGNLKVDPRAEMLNSTDFSDIYQFYIVPLSDYNRLAGTSETLSDGEALIFSYREAYPYDSFSINDGKEIKIVKTVDTFPDNGNAAMNIIPTEVLIVPDIESVVGELRDAVDEDGDSIFYPHWIYYFDTGLDREGEDRVFDAILDTVGMEPDREYHFTAFYIEGKEANRVDFYATFGGLFFLGIMLSIVFTLAAVLIIYYKQISEGYEDSARFEIMQNVGMTKKEIRKSINSQLLTVFFLPLIFAGMHVAFAFPVIQKLLLLFNLYNVKLFAIASLASFLVFALFYAIVYRITSNAYYSIVSGKEKTERV